MAYATPTLWLSPKHEIHNPDINSTQITDLCIFISRHWRHRWKRNHNIFWTFFDDSGHSSGELEVHTHTATMHPGKTTCIRLLRRRRGPNGLYAFILLRGEENLPSTTGRLRCHDHDRPGALRPMPASPTQPHTYKLPAASVDYIPTCSRPLIEFPTVSKKKAVRNH